MVADPVDLLAEHADFLFRMAMLRVRKHELAEDLVQETFLAAVRGAAAFSGQSSVRTWLGGILQHKIGDHFRKAGRESSFTDLVFLQDEFPERFEEDGFWNHERGPREWPLTGEDMLNRSELMAAILACIGKLPERVSAVFVMREVDSVESAEICSSLGLTRANLWVMLHRARMALRHCMETTYFAGESRA